MDVLVNASALSRKTRDSVSSNSCPILRLPNELLAEISVQFCLLKAAFNVPLEPQEVLPTNPYHWILISHICRRWRQAVLATPFVWATIVLPCNTAWIQILLNRSGQVPLTVIEDVAAVPTDEIQHGKDLVLQEIHRIRDLQIVVDLPAAYNLLAAFTSPNIGAPLLNALDIKLSRNVEYPAEPVSVLPEDSLPRLRHVTFRHDFDEARYGSDLGPIPGLDLTRQLLRPSLTSLHLYSLTTPLSADVCLEILESLSNLEDLILGEVLTVSTATPGRSLTTSNLVHLPHLRNLALHGSSQWLLPEDDDSEIIYDGGTTAANILQHLVIPSSAEISFTAGEEYLKGQSLDFMCGVLKDAVAGLITTVIGPPNLPVTSLCVTVSPVMIDTFECVVELLISPQLTEGLELNDISIQDRQREIYRTGRRVLRAQFRTDLYPFIDCVCSVLTSLGSVLSSVSTLYFQGHVEHPVLRKEEDIVDGIWRCIRDTMPELRELAVMGHSGDFIRWLASKKDGPPISILPCLCGFEIDASGCNEASSSGEESDGSESGSECEGTRGQIGGFTNKLIAALRAWSEQSDEVRRLQYLIIHNFHDVGQENLSRIRESGIAEFVGVVESV
ncbi:hypothetical protein BDY19DRAFT_1056499 [Irpex rosettiformis]|uniref:Uncharacterized protein n=1 Tax=Irpex rosettiformis TaxID=378272 RepID=A0ACB8U5G7_9APHY|nr:hypothetical protein BDY19DRAFT_1056499 [Irpex rosettiformis]